MSKYVHQFGGTDSVEFAIQVGNNNNMRGVQIGKRKSAIFLQNGKGSSMNCYLKTKRKIFLLLTVMVFMVGSGRVFGQICPADSGSGNQNSGENMGKQDDYQKQILSNPETNQGARVGIGSNQTGGNTAIINQNGSSNSSSIIQSGSNNKAEQYQKGKNNSLHLNQKGKNNYHKESQIGDNNKKVIIQNDSSEVIIEQVVP